MRVPYRKPGKYSQIKNDPNLTEDKLNALKNKLEHLKKNRPDAARDVGRLAELGDFSENVEYQLAKGKLRGINSGILSLERQINQAIIIMPLKNNGTVQLGSMVTVQTGGKEREFKILGSAETSPKLGIISHNSPLGVALMGHKVGDMIKIVLAKKTVEYKIIQID